MERRTFIGAAVTAAVGVAGGLAYWLRGRPAPVPDAHQHDEAEAQADCDPPALARFPQRYGEALQVMTDRIAPPHGELPGAAALGAWDYILRELATERGKRMFRIAMRGAPQLDKLTGTKFNSTFAQAKPEQQDAIIQAMLDGEGAVPGKFEPPVFVETMISLTVEGMYADPKYGGNRDGLGWGSIGYNMHPPRPGACGH